MTIYGIKSNFIFNLVGTIIPLIVALATIPIYISHIGSARYGVLSIVWVLLGYFGFLDLGISRAAANALAKLGLSSHKDRSKVLITAICVNLCLGAFGGVILYFAGSFLVEHLLASSAYLKPEIEKAFPWIAVLLPIALVSGVGSGALEARERFLAANLLQVVGTIIGQVLPVICAVLVSPSLSVVIPAAVLSRALSVLLILGFVIREERPLSLRNFDWKHCRTLLGYGGWVSMSNIISPLMTSLDQLMIGSMLGVTALTHYSVPMSLVIRTQILAAALSRTLFPRMSRSTGEDAKKLADKALVTLAYGYGAICAPAIVLAKPFIVFWIGDDFASVAGPVAELLLIGAWINGLAFIPFALLQAQGHPDIVAKFHALEVIPYIFILWFLMIQYGLLGAALAWVLRVTVDAGLLFAAARLRTADVVPLSPPLGFILSSYLILQIINPTPTGAILIAAFLGLGVAIAGVFFDRNARAFVFSLRFSRQEQD